jgi:hypothetical protein
MTPVLETRNESQVDLLEKKFLELPQAECTVIHRFGPGIYVRELRMKAGTFAIGHAQKYSHLNIVLSGIVVVHNDDGSTSTITAPATFVAPPGRKVGYVVEDVVWQNVYATDETDIEKLENMFVDRSEEWHRVQAIAIPFDRTEDRVDFLAAIAEYGFTPEMVREQSECTTDMVNLIAGAEMGYTIQNSDIEGRGVFATAPYAPEQYITLTRIGAMRTHAGRFLNHSKNPNAEMREIGGGVCLVAIRDIYGSHGGERGEEITVDYRAVLELQGVKKVSV